jgi:DNA polymerase V
MGTCLKHVSWFVLSSSHPETFSSTLTHRCMIDPPTPDRFSDEAASSEQDPTVVSISPAALGRECARPLFLSRIEAGFPSPADDYIEARLDLNEHLVQRESATFFLRVAGGSMREAGIHDGDLLVVDRSIEPEDGTVVVAALDGELTVKRYREGTDRPYLVPESATHDPIPIQEGQELVVWGVVRHVIHEVS